MDNPITSLREFSVPPWAEIESFASSIERWFGNNRREFYWREESAGHYAKIVSEVLLQRTQAGVVSSFLPQFLGHFPGWESIARAEEEEIGQVLKPLGLWRRRAKSLKALAGDICRRGGQWPETREELESMPAVGQYVASAVLLFVHGKTAPLMDASMARLLRRYFGITPVKADIRHDANLHAVANQVLGAGNPVLLNWAMLDFAALQCRNGTFGCESCPLRSGCSEPQAPPDRCS